MRVLWIVEPSSDPNRKGWMVRWKEPHENDWNWVMERVFVPGSPNELNYRDVRKVYKNRLSAIKATAATCRHNLEVMNELSEMQVRKLDGSWAKEKRTYGKDPRGNG